MLSWRSACYRWRLQCRFGGQDVCRGGARGRGLGGGGCRACRGDAGRVGRAREEMCAAAGPCFPTPLYLDTPHLVQVTNGARSSEQAYLAFLPLAIPRK